MRDVDGSGFDLDGFLPYLLNQAAEASSHSFAEIYRRDYGMTRTQWRVMANLGRFGSLSASDICRTAHIDKTKVSRAVAQLEGWGYLTRSKVEADKRREMLALTRDGQVVFARLGAQALAFQAELAQRLGAERLAMLDTLLRDLINLHRSADDAGQ